MNNETNLCVGSIPLVVNIKDIYLYKHPFNDKYLSSLTECKEICLLIKN